MANPNQFLKRKNSIGTSGSSESSSTSSFISSSTSSAFSSQSSLDSPMPGDTNTSFTYDIHSMERYLNLMVRNFQQNSIENLEISLITPTDQENLNSVTDHHAFHEAFILPNLTPANLPQSQEHPPQN